MKYLCLHNLLGVVILIAELIVEILFYGLVYILYIIWNFKIPRNFWLKLHSYRSLWNYKLIADKNPMQTFVRRYKYIFNDD